jgi:hypothetical protein
MNGVDFGNEASARSKVLSFDFGRDFDAKGTENFDGNFEFR